MFWTRKRLFESTIWHVSILSAIIAVCGEIVSDNTVCFDNCNNHGDCIDYTCHCHIGYHGDDCSTSFLDTNDGSTSYRIIPILGAGHYNLTIHNYTASIAKVFKTKSTSMAVIGFSSPSCYKCIRFEKEYDQLSNALLELKIPFFRTDADNFRDITKSLNVIELPALAIYYKKNKPPIVYSGVHEYQSMIAYIHKLMQKSSVRQLDSVPDVFAFIDSSFNSTQITPSAANGVSTSEVLNSLRFVSQFVTPSTALKVIGFFQDIDGMEEDEYKDFFEIATAMKTHNNIYFGAMIKRALCNEFKINSNVKVSSTNTGDNNTERITKQKSLLNWIDKVPSVCLILSDSFNANEKLATRIDTNDHNSFISQLMLSARPICVSLDELYYGAGLQERSKTSKSGNSLSEWILNNAVPLVAKLTPFNFAFYEKSNKPMLMLFLDLRYEHQSTSPLVVGGKSGNVLNQVLISEFRSVAKEYYSEIFFVYVDGLKYPEQMKKLGLKVGGSRSESNSDNDGAGVSHLPSMAFNTKDNIQLPFPESLSISQETINQFCASFLNGHLKNMTKMTAKALKVIDSKHQQELISQSPTFSESSSSSVLPHSTVDAMIIPSPQLSTTTSKSRVILEQTKGVLEFFGDEEEVEVSPSQSNELLLLPSSTSSAAFGSETDRVSGSVNIMKVTKDSFHSLVMENDEIDVLLLFYVTDSTASGNFLVFYKRLCQRLFELNTSSTLLLTRMDVTVEVPPLEYQFFLGSHSSSSQSQLPALVLIPGSAKHPPWNFYSGRGQSVKDMLEWVNNHVTNKFTLPTSLPHLTDQEKVLYKEQMHEREAILMKQASRDRIAHSKEEYNTKMEKYHQRIDKARRISKNNSYTINDDNNNTNSCGNNTSN